ncbi:bacterial peptide chain release factor 2 (bRF-2) [Caldanaerobius fijiensis DSM 17918]|uniref:Peptide chain release factor 2 n=1 Tax=Caldanaerobius fijiensis DSM 17918 TaxID=1121256 RepID=A0A1M4UZ48_9THEO|nr:bacterial peptide chain release factor 2 (bRF-2) [Caldanaerobius fijiensis DSM 17918]
MKWGFLFDYAGSREELKKMEESMADPDFWSDIEKASKVNQKIKVLKDKLDQYDSIRSRYDDLTVLLELAYEEGDESLEPEIQSEYQKLQKDVADMKIKLMLNGRYDANNAIMSFHAGAGGTEAQDWAQMLIRMYTRWAERRGFEVDILDYLEGDEAGVKNATLMVKGDYAYGYLKAEKGVHRLVRISPFDAAGRRHTSFALVEVLPEITEDIDVEINPADLKIDTYRSSGAGGQHVNKTESAVRITHIPTGIVVQCQNERSQLQNRETAMKMLKARLLELKEREREEEISGIKGEHVDMGWGNQIRSYVFHPYSMVKDHRTGYEVGNVQAVMDGEIDDFINEYLKKMARENSKISAIE